jgi:hypothetical protein
MADATAIGRLQELWSDWHNRIRESSLLTLDDKWFHLNEMFDVVNRIDRNTYQLRVRSLYLHDDWNLVH